MDKIHHVITCFVVAFLTAVYSGVDAQTIRQINAARLKEIVYPPLTEREGKDLILPVPPAEHPRLFFRKSDLPAIKINVQHPLLKESWEKVKSSADFKTDGKLPQGKPNYDLRIIDAIEAKAFMYALTGDKKTGNDAVDGIFNLNNTFISDPQNVYATSLNCGRIIVATSVVYDWCYDLIALAEKKMLIAFMESLATNMELKWPQLVQGSVVGHGTGTQLLKNILIFGIATCDEKPEIYLRAAGRIFAEMIPAQKFVYQSGYHHQGSAYGPGRFSCELYPTFLFGRMGYQVTSELQGKMPYRWIYTRRPDGQLFRDGDDYIEQWRSAVGQYWSFADIAYLASYYRDPLLMGEAIRQGSIGQEPLYDLLLIDPSISADNNLASLPLSKFFPYPFGGMVARTGWENGSTSSTVVADMKIVERHFGNHQHLDAGSFQIYYKGPLAVESGIYEGVEGGYGDSHFVNYYQRTIAHNCMLVYDPNEKFIWNNRPISNDGGQRWPANGSEPATLELAMSEEYKDYVVSSNKDFKKTWLLHCVQEPVFIRNTCTVVRNEKGYNGKLVNTVLLPQNVVWEKVGGSGNEYNVGGVNYPNRHRTVNNSSDGAIWRVELSPETPSETDVFLNVMQVSDAENTQLLPVEKIETGQMIGVQIGDRIVLFSKNGNPENLPINLTINGDGTFKVLITDLEKGNWVVTGSKSPGMVRNDHNLVYFQATTGNYKITKQ